MIGSLFVLCPESCISDAVVGQLRGAQVMEGAMSFMSVPEHSFARTSASHMNPLSFETPNLVLKKSKNGGLCASLSAWVNFAIPLCHKCRQ